MNQKIIIIVIALIIIGGSGMMFSFRSENGVTQKEVQKSIVQSSLVTDSEQYDFGIIDIFSGKVTTEFPVTNTGEEAITVLDGTTSCACTSAELEGVGFDMHNGMKREVVIEPGETKILTATYDPLFHGPNGTGKITREVILKTNSSVTPEVRARFKAEVIKNVTQ